MDRIHPNVLDDLRSIDGPDLSVEVSWCGRPILILKGSKLDCTLCAKKAHKVAYDTLEAIQRQRGFALGNRRECGRYAARIKEISLLIQERRAEMSFLPWLCMKISQYLFKDECASFFSASKQLDTLFYPDFTRRPLTGIEYAPDAVTNAALAIINGEYEPLKHSFYRALYDVASAENPEKHFPLFWGETHCMNPKEVSQDLLRRALQTVYIRDPEAFPNLTCFLPKTEL